MPGDVDSNDRVLFGGDATTILPQIGAQLGDANYNFRADVDGSGRILFGDVAQVLGRIGNFLNSTPLFFSSSFQPTTFSLSSFSLTTNADSDGQLGGNFNQSSASSDPSMLAGAIEGDSSLQNVDDTFADLFGQNESDSAIVDASTSPGNQIELDV